MSSTETSPYYAFMADESFGCTEPVVAPVVEAELGSVEDAAMREEVFAWIKQNPGVDSEDVAKNFDIDDRLASDLVEALLREGRLGFA